MNYYQVKAIRALVAEARKAVAALKIAGYIVTADALTEALVETQDKFSEVA